MDIGLACSFTVPNGHVLAEAITGAARAAESLGLATFWAAGDREAATERSHDPTLGIFVVAQATTKIRIGLSGDLPAARSAAVRAKQIATIDWFSAGRLSVGVDLAPPPADLLDPYYEATGSADPTALAIERYAAMRTLWTEDNASFHGKHLSFHDAYALPQPQGARVPATHVRAGDAASLAQFAEACGPPDGILWWLVEADDVSGGAARLADVLPDAGSVRTSWCVPAGDFRTAVTAAPQLGARVDELIAWFDHVPSEPEIAALVS